MGGYAVAKKYLVERELQPGTDLGGGRWNPRQVRKDTAHQTSDRLNWHQMCIAGAMSGKTGKLGDIQDAFKSATKSCASENPYPKAK